MFILQIDGFLFYYKMIYYIFGFIFFVVWLKLYMLLEIFEIEVLEKFLVERLDNYLNYVVYFEYVVEMKKK